MFYENIRFWLEVYVLIYGNAASNRDALLPFIIEKVNDYGVLKRLQRMFADNQSYASEIKIGEKISRMRNVHP